MEEKVFTITERRGKLPNGEENVIIKEFKESELTKTHIDLILGDLLNIWDKSPSIVKTRFMQMLSDDARDRFASNRYEIFKEVISASINNKEESQ